jgi:hypothetical protein
VTYAYLTLIGSEAYEAGVCTQELLIVRSNLLGLLHRRNNSGRKTYAALHTICKGDRQAAWPQSITLATHSSSSGSNQMR